MYSVEYTLMVMEPIKPIKRKGTRTERQAAQFLSQIDFVRRVAYLYLAGKLTERQVISFLIDAILRMDIVCEQVHKRLRKETRG